MIAAAGLRQLCYDLNFPATDRQSILIKTNLFIMERQTVDDLFDLSPHLIYHLQLALPTCFPQFPECNLPYRLPKSAHIGMSMNDGNVD